MSYTTVQVGSVFELRDEAGTVIHTYPAIISVTTTDSPTNGPPSAKRPNSRTVYVFAVGTNKPRSRDDWSPRLKPTVRCS